MTSKPANVDVHLKATQDRIDLTLIGLLLANRTQKLRLYNIYTYIRIIYYYTLRAEDQRTINFCSRS